MCLPRHKKDLRSIPLELVQHIIELNTSLPRAHQVRYKLNPKSVAIVKQDIDKLLAVGFIQPIEEATRLSPIVIMLKKNSKLIICVDFRKLSKAIKKILILSHFLMKY